MDDWVEEMEDQPIAAGEDAQFERFNLDELLAKRGKDGGIDYQNWQYLNYKPGMNRMPPGLETPLAQKILQDIRNTGADYSWQSDAQMKCFNRNAFGATANPNRKLAAAGMETGPQYIRVLLSPDATATTAYEEYLHVLQAQARGWMPYLAEEKDKDAQEREMLEEEIRVEYQVMQQAQWLGTTAKEWQILSRNRKRYMEDLRNRLGGVLPDNLKPYLDDPPQPPMLHAKKRRKK
jgi:hypothetical protein